MVRCEDEEGVGGGDLPRASSQAENLSKLVTATTAGRGAFIQRSRRAAMGSGSGPPPPTPPAQLCHCPVIHYSFLAAKGPVWLLNASPALALLKRCHRDTEQLLRTSAVPGGGTSAATCSGFRAVLTPPPGPCAVRLVLRNPSFKRFTDPSPQSGPF